MTLLFHKNPFFPVVRRCATLGFASFCLFLFLALMTGAQAEPAGAGTRISVTATARYVPAGFTQVESASSNSVVATVLAVEAAVLTQSQSLTGPPGTSVVLSHLLTNTGNVASNYTFELNGDQASCPGSSMTLAPLHLFRDINRNGSRDNADAPLPLKQASAVTLAPGESAQVLVEATLPMVASGQACALLSATTALQKITVSNTDTITVSRGAILSLFKSASHPGVVVPGQSRIDYTVTATNIGGSDALPSASMVSPMGSLVVDNSANVNLVLMRDVIPVGTRYVSGSLKTASANAVLLYRNATDANFKFQTVEGPDTAEVAVGLRAPMATGATFALQFAVMVDSAYTGDIRNIAQAHYNDGVHPDTAASNPVVLAAERARIGLSKEASAPIANLGPDGQPDGTATIRYQVHARSYGAAWLYNVQATDLLEGGGNKFGTYTADTVPAANQYTIVAGSVVATGSHPVAVDPAFNGTAAFSNLFAPNGQIAPHTQTTVQFDVRVNLAGRTAPLVNTARGTASTGDGGSASVADDSVDGPDPDPDGDGDPTNNTSSTHVAAELPVLTLSKSASLPRRMASDQYEIDYVLRVANNGRAPAPNVRVIENLNCAFDKDSPEAAVDSWELTGAPKARQGLLTVSSGFTGNASCNRAQFNSPDPFNLPNEVALSTTDGSRPLAPGQSEEIAFTVRVKLKAGKSGRATILNKAWAASYTQNTINFNAASVVAATSATAQSLLTDPAGIVYDAATRRPVAGAVVTYTRQSCTVGMTGPITAAEIHGGSSGAYVFNANGSVSMTTAADGAYQFFLRTPPVSSLCTYALTVAPPAGSAYLAPSELLPATAGTFASCGAVVASPAAPQGAEPAIYYNSLTSGVGGADGAVCDVVHNHLPLDPGNIKGVILRMEGSKRQAELGDFIDYALTITNRTGTAITGFDFQNKLPPGFAYLPRSAQLQGVASPDPSGGAGPQLTFHHPELQLAADASATLRFRVRIGVGAPTSGDANNTAVGQAGPLRSNQANWMVRISGGVFSDDAFAFGKVYLDCKRDGQQEGQDEVGIPGVRLYMENGTFVVTDAEGKWSLYGLKPVTHVLRVDETTLPPGARLEILDNRNAGNPASRFVDLVKGELHKADFIVGNCDEAVVANVTARRVAIKANPNAEGEAQMRMRLDPEARPFITGDTRALPASGQSAVGGGVSGQLSSVTTPLIALPVAPGNGLGNRFVNATGSTPGTLGTLANSRPAPAGSLFAPVTGMPDMAQPSPITGGSATGPGSQDTRPVASAAAMLDPQAPAMLPPAKPSPIELVALVTAQADNSLAFLNLRDGDTVPGQSINVQVKGAEGTTLRLQVNGELLDEKRVGKKATMAEKKLEAREYIGVLLKPGQNELRLDAVDSFGNVRGEPQVVRIVAPDRLGLIQIDAPPSARADLKTPIVIRVRLTDANGIPVTARTQLTLESDRGRWLDDDLNATERGHQVFMEGGQAEFRLLPPGEPGNVRIRVSAGEFVREVTVALLADLRPMIGVGVIEGVLDLSNRGKLPLGSTPAGAAFESELSSLGGDSSGSRAGGRAAFFLKGAIKGEYLLTASFDSNKAQKDRLFRDIRPDEFYPVYGDSSVRGFDAQSTQRLYVRVDKDRSFLLYGDFTTSSSTEVRSLSQSNRVLTGVKQVYDDAKVRATTYAANTSQSQQVEEFRALGTSGPYFLAAGNGTFVDNSEQIEIVVRDRSQPNIVLSRTPVVRYTDYTIETLTRRILFTQAISSVDSNLNPQSIRVTYEVDSGGEKFVVAGTDVQVKVNDGLQLGVVASTDRNPENKRDLAAVTALARLGDKTTLAAEVVQTKSDDKGTGTGARAELRVQDEKLAAVALVSKTSAGFDNPGSSNSAGRTDASARAEYRIDPSLALRGEALYSKDVTQNQDRAGATMSVQKKVTDTTTVEAGLRYGQSNATLGSSSGFDYGTVSTYNNALGSSLGAGNATSLGGAANNATNNSTTQLTTVRARVSTQVPGLPRAQAFVEGEQSLNDSDRQTLAVGANYALTDKTRAYGRYELISGLYGPFQAGGTQVNNTGILGIESAYMEGGRVYNEYRMAESVDGRGVVGALGVRNTYQLTERVRITGGLEHTRNLSSASNSVNNGTGYGSVLGSSTAVTGGIEYSIEGLKTSAILEARKGSDSDTLLFSGGAAYRLSPEMNLLGRSVVSDSSGKGSSTGNERHLQRHQIGLAYRPVDTNVWNALARYEHKTDRVVGSGNSSGSAFFGNGSVNASLPGTYTTDIVAAHLNVNPRRGTYITSRYAVKLSRAEDTILNSRYWAQLLQGRVTQDLNDKWDVGIQGGVLYGQGGALQKTMGAELGYQIYRDIWVAGGYNIVGLTDRDLAANEYTSEGAYLRMRMKFDETALGFRTPDATAAQTVADPAGSVKAAEAVPVQRLRESDVPLLNSTSTLGSSVVAHPAVATPVRQPEALEPQPAAVTAPPLPVDGTAAVVH